MIQLKLHQEELKQRFLSKLYAFLNNMKIKTLEFLYKKKLYVEICKDIRSSEYYRGLELATEGKNN